MDPLELVDGIEDAGQLGDTRLPAAPELAETLLGRGPTLGADLIDDPLLEAVDDIGRDGPVPLRLGASRVGLIELDDGQLATVETGRDRGLSGLGNRLLGVLLLDRGLVEALALVGQPVELLAWCGLEDLLPPGATS